MQEWYILYWVFILRSADESVPYPDIPVPFCDFKTVLTSVKRCNVTCLRWRPRDCVAGELSHKC